MKNIYQQKQTKRFFESFSNQWSKSSKDKSSDFYNVIKIRNDYVLSVVKKHLDKNSKILDVACGTGDLVIELLKQGYDACGFDFAESMIKKAKSHAKKENLPSKNFFVASFFDFIPDFKFDLISANGFIPYISQKQLELFIKKSRIWLNTNGILVCESRNRLFNCVSFNNYTKDETKLKELNHLLEECILFNKSKNIKELINRKFKPKIVKNLNKHDTVKSKHGNVMIETMFQYTPFQLFNILRKNKFKILDLYPTHIHAITTGAKEKSPKIHKKLSEYLLNQKSLHMQLIPHSSSFSIAAKKA